MPLACERGGGTHEFSQGYENENEIRVSCEPSKKFELDSFRAVSSNHTIYHAFLDEGKTFTSPLFAWRMKNCCFVFRRVHSLSEMCNSVDPFSCMNSSKKVALEKTRKVPRKAKKTDESSNQETDYVKVPREELEGLLELLKKVQDRLC